MSTDRSESKSSRNALGFVRRLVPGRRVPGRLVAGGSAAAIGKRMLDQVDSSVLVLFRIVVGVAVCVWAQSFLADDRYIGLYLEPRLLFKYDHFGWVKLWPGQGIHWHFVVTKVAAICLALGLLTRVSAAIVSLAITYVLLVDCQSYVNHYYLLACAAGLLVFLPAGRRFSIDSWIGYERKEKVFPRWQLWLMRFQLGLPYVGGAIAKLNSDWFAGQPAGLIISRHLEHPLLGPLLSMPGMTQLFVYGGILFDLCVVPLLLYRPTRSIAVALALIFHLTNAAMLPIGVFPWFMLATLVVFFPAETVSNRKRIFLGQSVLRGAGCGEGNTGSGNTGRDEPGREKPKLGDSSRSDPGATMPPMPGAPMPGAPLPGAPMPGIQTASWVTRSGWLLASTYVVIQLLLPMRPWIYRGDANWNERGHRFAWRMMLRRKEALTHYLVVDVNTNDYLFVPSTVVLTATQAAEADYHPELIRQTAVELGKLAVKLGAADHRVHALALVSLNGRRPKPIVDPMIDLSKAARFGPGEDWICEDAGPFHDPPWLYPKDEWWNRIELPEPFKANLQGRKPSDLQAFLEQLDASRERSGAAAKINVQAPTNGDKHWQLPSWLQ